MFNLEIIQGSAEWRSLRKTKITATDAPVIMGENPWKTPWQLFNEKIDPNFEVQPNEAMERGSRLEPLAREKFIEDTGKQMRPIVVVKDWAMASLDGISECGKLILEIKCPKPEIHEMAKKGEIPVYYMAQIQHQLYVTGLEMCYYYSFDGFEGTIVMVYRDDDYIERMVVEEKKFYDDMIQGISPPSKCVVSMEEDEVWRDTAFFYWEVDREIKILERRKEALKNQLIFLSNGLNSKGCGVVLTKSKSVGVVDYKAIVSDFKVDIEKYRKEPKEETTWRVTCK